jgi:glycosyltransferase involved in cell wall biosynthesis
VIGITRFEINQIQSSEAFKKKCFVIGEFLDDKNYSESDTSNATISDFGLPDNLLSVVSVGGIHQIKGTKEYLLAANMVLQTNTNVCFVLAGREDRSDIRYYNECKELISQLQLTGRFFFPGVVKDIVSLIRRSFALVSTNTVTHFSRPVIEAWAQKKPVIISDVEHGKILVSDGIDGLIYSKDSPESLASKINTLINDRTLAEQLAENGFKKAVEYYHAGKNTDLICNKCELLTRDLPIHEKVDQFS